MLSECKLIDMQVVQNELGNLAICECQEQVPFYIKRVYWLYNVPAGAQRGGHAHRNLQQLIIAASGSFEVHVDDGIHKATYMLNNPSQGLYIPKMIWREINHFSYGSSCIVLASEHYDESDYFRQYNEFLQHINTQ